jgi:hypothetical protein
MPIRKRTMARRGELKDSEEAWLRGDRVSDLIPHVQEHLFHSRSIGYSNATPSRSCSPNYFRAAS